MAERKYDVYGMHCAACASAVERVTKKVAGVTSSNVNLITNKLTVTYDVANVGDIEEFDGKICAKIKKAGFEAEYCDGNKKAKTVKDPLLHTSN